MSDANKEKSIKEIKESSNKKPATNKTKQASINTKAVVKKEATEVKKKEALGGTKKDTTVKKQIVPKEQKIAQKINSTAKVVNKTPTKSTISKSMSNKVNQKLENNKVHHSTTKRVVKSVNLERKQERKQEIKEEKIKEKIYERVEILPPGQRGKDVFKIPFLIPILIVIALIVLILSIFIFNQKKVYSEKIERVEIKIESGMSAFSVAALLPSEIDKKEFLLYLDKNDLTNKIQVGNFIIEEKMKVDEIVNIITNKQQSLVVYPAFTLKDLDIILHKTKKTSINEFLDSADEFCNSRNLKFSEGWFLSGTYSYSSIDKLLFDMNTELLNLFKAHSEALSKSNLTIEEIVIISSMIIRETQDVSQMPIIASIILNRYSSSMPLGIDATTRYELEDWENPISQDVYDNITPYNTRRKKGLPPSGIGCPSEQAILAVLYPDVTEALYYFHDKDGNLHTSLTYEEHLDKHSLYY